MQASLKPSSVWAVSGCRENVLADPGVVSTNVGYAGGQTPNPTYEEVCGGGTGHVEVVRVFSDPSRVGYDELLRVFWEGHDPTQGMRQGNDTGTVCAPRSITSTMHSVPRQNRRESHISGGCGKADTARSRPRLHPHRPSITPKRTHQQYLSKNPNGYCGHGGTGVSCPIGLTAAG